MITYLFAFIASTVSTVGSALSVIGSHLKYWRENYILIPAIIIALMAAIYFVGSLTGRVVIEQPGQIIDCLYNAVAIVIAICLTGITQKSLTGYRSENFIDTPTCKELPPLSADLLDSCTTLYLLSLYCWLLLH